MAKIILEKNDRVYTANGVFSIDSVVGDGCGLATLKVCGMTNIYLVRPQTVDRQGNISGSVSLESTCEERYKAILLTTEKEKMWVTLSDDDLAHIEPRLDGDLAYFKSLELFDLAYPTAAFLHVGA